MRMSDLAHQDYVIKAEAVEDILRAHETGRVAHVFGLEAATMIENEVDRIDVLYGFGVRQIGIAYSEANTLGSGLKERGDGGLTYFGEPRRRADEQARHGDRHLALWRPHVAGRHRGVNQADPHHPLRVRARYGRPPG